MIFETSFFVEKMPQISRCYFENMKESMKNHGR